jgi:hypothetical protein
MSRFTRKSHVSSRSREPPHRSTNAILLFLELSVRDRAENPRLGRRRPRAPIISAKSRTLICGLETVTLEESLTPDGLLTKPFVREARIALLRDSAPVAVVTRGHRYLGVAMRGQLFRARGALRSSR